MLRNLGKLLVASLLAAGMAAPAAASALGDAAASLQAGQWKVLNRSGDGSGFDYKLIESCGDDCGDVILNYADKGLWNPLTREMHFIGKGHYRALKHISYSEATNKWALEANPYWTCGSPWSSCLGMGHGYEHTTLNPANGDIFARVFNSTEVYRWTRSNKTWSRLPAAPNPTIAAGMEYFPELGGIVLAGNGEVHFYKESTQSWSRLGASLSMGPYHNIAIYNPVHKVVLFGGGNDSSRLYKLDATGKVTAIAAAPANIGILQSVFTADPASGKYLLFTSGGSFYEYDVPTNRWSSLPAGNVAMFNGGNNRILWRIAIPVPTYGVIAFLAEGGSDTKVLLYRHSSGSGAPVDTTAPPPPAALTVQ